MQEFKHSAQFRQALETGNVALLRKLWKEIAPGMPQPKTYAEAEIVMHYTRTQAESVSFKARAYSHRWLVERSLPSALPDDMRPKAERMYPVVAEGIGVSINFKSPLLQPLVKPITQAVNDAIMDASAKERRDAPLMRARIREVKNLTLSKLLGSTGSLKSTPPNLG